MRNEELKPVVLPILIAYIAGAGATVGAIALLLLGLRVPSQVALPSLAIASLAVSFLVVLQVSSAYWYRLTQTYTIMEDHLLVRRGWFSKTMAEIPFRNMSEVKASTPVLLRPFHVGSVLVSTNDGSIHILNNVRDPQRVVQGMSSR